MRNAHSRMQSRARLECPQMHALIALATKPARSAREFMTMCGTTADQARRTRDHLATLGLIRVHARRRGSLTVKSIELTTLGNQVARLLVKVDEMIASRQG